jgi:hypothetical protein
MATLTYNLEIIGRQAIERELASLEKRFAAHASRVNKATGGAAAGGAAGAGRSTGTRDPIFGPGRREQMAALRAREKAEINSARTVARAKLTAERDLDRARTSLDRQRSRALLQQHREAEAHRARTINARSEFVRSTFGGTARRVVNGLTAVGQAGAAALGLGGTAMAVNAVQSSIGLDERARRLAIAGRNPGERGMDPEALRRQFVQTGIASGFSGEDIASGIEVYTAKTGDLQGALANQRVFATAAQAHGAKPSEIFEAAADLSSKLDIRSVKDMSEAFAILGQQGKKGSFELKAMAKEFPEILSNAANIGVRGVSGLRDVGAMAQIARQASGSDAEASTALNTFFRKFADEAKNLQKGKYTNGKGVQVFEGNDPRNKMLDFTAIFRDFMTKSEGDLTAFQSLFDVRGSKAGNPLANAYREARDATLKGGGSKKDANAAGMNAVDDLFGKFRNVSGDWQEVQRDAADAMRSVSVQLEIISTKFKDVVGSQLLPELAKLIPVLTEMIPQVASVVRGLVRLAKFLTENPLTGLAGFIGASFAIELGKAGIAALFTKAINAIMTRTAPGAGGLGAGGAAAGAGGGLLAAAGAGLTIGAGIATAIYVGGVAKYEEGENSMAQGGSALNTVRSASVDDIAMVKQTIAEQRKRTAAAGTMSAFDDLLDMGGASNKAVEAQTQQAFLSEMVEKLASLEMQQAANAQKEAAASLKDSAESLRGAGGSRPNTGDRPSDANAKN